MLTRLDYISFDLPKIDRLKNHLPYMWSLNWVCWQWATKTKSQDDAGWRKRQEIFLSALLWILSEEGDSTAKPTAQHLYSATSKFRLRRGGPKQDPVRWCVHRRHVTIEGCRWSFLRGSGRSGGCDIFFWFRFSIPQQASAEGLSRAQHWGCPEGMWL